MTRPDLPDFQNPPLSEVYLSLQYETPPAYQRIYARDIWNLFQKEFPLVQEYPELPPNFEIFGGSLNRLQFFAPPFGAPFGNRYWFLKEDQTELIQFQSDRFLHNWRKTDQNNSYPRFEKIFEAYSKELKTLEEFYLAQGWGGLKFNQCEICYINNIQLTDGKGNSLPIFKDFEFSFIKDQTDYSFNTRKVLLSDEKKPLGRLYLDAATGLDINRNPILSLNITVKGPPENSTSASALSFLCNMRKDIVNCFANITNKEMHTLWGRKK